MSGFPQRWTLFGGSGERTALIALKVRPEFFLRPFTHGRLTKFSNVKVSQGGINSPILWCESFKMKNCTPNIDSVSDWTEKISSCFILVITRSYSFRNHARVHICKTYHLSFWNISGPLWVYVACWTYVLCDRGFIGEMWVFSIRDFHADKGRVNLLQLLIFFLWCGASFGQGG